MDINEIVNRRGYSEAVRAQGDESRRLSGHAILFNSPSGPLWRENGKVVREVIAPQAITLELLNRCDILFTLFHDNRAILARSVNGSGTLTYSIDDKGVAFSFDAPHTYEGDKAVELVRRGELSGCSFAFSTKYFNPGYVERTETSDEILFTVRRIMSISDFTLTTDPAYPSTEVSASFRDKLRAAATPAPATDPAALAAARLCVCDDLSDY